MRSTQNEGKVVATLQGHTAKKLPTMKRAILMMFLLVQGAFAATRWSPGVFPNPETNPRDCHISQGSARICDPDGILGEDTKRALVDVISTFEETHGVPCSSIKTDEGGFDIQIAVLSSTRWTCSNTETLKTKKSMPLKTLPFLFTTNGALV
jgi:hypothetical protein